MLQRIVVPIDFSSCADHATLVALRLASLTHSRITFVHYFDKPWFSSEAPLRHLNASKTKGHVVNLARKAELELPEHVDFYAKSGKLLKQLPEFMGNHLVSMVIMGTKGENGSNKATLGSHTLNFINRTDTPVLAVPENGTFHNRDKMLYITDRKSITGITFDTVLKLAQLFNAVITVLHIGKKSDGKTVWNESPFAIDIYSYKNIENKFLDSDNVIEGIQKYIAENQPSFISLSVKDEGAMERLFNQSAFHEMLSAERIPLLAAN